MKVKDLIRIELIVLIYRDLKKYIKTSSCYPDRCRKSDYENIMQDFKTSEKVGYNNNSNIGFSFQGTFYEHHFFQEMYLKEVMLVKSSLK